MPGLSSRALVAVGCLGLFALACAEEVAPPEPVVRPIRILEIAAAGAGESLEFPGTIQAGRTADLAFEVPGKIIERPTREGQSVAEGDLLARLDPRDYQSALAAKQALHAAARADFERTQALFDADAASKQQLDAMRRNFEVAGANVQAAAKAVADCRLLAPFDGVVARIGVENFENVQAKQRIILVQNDSMFDVKVAIPEQDAARIRPGLTREQMTARAKPKVEISSIPGRSFDARMTEFSGAADPTTRTFSATFQFDNPGDVSIATGMTAKLRISVPADVAGTSGPQVPSAAAVADESGDFYVWVVDPATLAVTRRAVELGTLTGDSVRILSGLTGNEWIAVSGVHHLREGMIVSRMGS